MKVLLVAEGQHELGDGTAAGALEVLVRRLSGGQVLQIDRRKVSDPSLRAFHGTGQGFYKRALRWLLHAAGEGYDALVLVVDHDGHDVRLRQIDDAQDSGLTPLPRALGVAVRTFDAWMLADERALSIVLGRPIARQTDPESIAWPKERCTELRNSADSDLGLAALYAAVATQADPTILERRCPRGFAPFAFRTRQPATTDVS